MALRTPRTDLHVPAISRTFTTADYGAADIALADQLEPNNSVSPAGAPAAGINHLPSVLFLVAEAGQALSWEDILGNINTITFVAPFYGTLPFTARIIRGPETTAASVTASWHPEA